MSLIEVLLHYNLRLLRFRFICLCYPIMSFLFNLTATKKKCNNFECFTVYFFYLYTYIKLIINECIIILYIWFLKYLTSVLCYST